MYAHRYEPTNMIFRVDNGRVPPARRRRQPSERAPRVDWRPAIDVGECPDRFVIAADLPGVDPKDIEVTMDDGVLSIRGTRLESEDASTARLRRAERRSGSFSRSFSLPDTADENAITATSSHGVLRVEIGKKAAVQPRRIAVN